MIKNYIFDFGNVITRFYPDELTAPYVEEEQLRAYMRDVVFDRKIWDKLDDGSYTDELARAEICKSLPEDKHALACKIYDGWISNLVPVDGMCELIEDIAEKTDKGLYLLSNISLGFAEKYGENPWISNLFKRFDGLVFSGALGIVKPTEDIFRYLLNRYDLSASECLFVDDSERNIIGAEKVGIKGYLFDKNTDKLREYIGL